MNLLFILVSTAIASFIWLYLFRIADVFSPQKWVYILLFFLLGTLSVSIPLGLDEIVSIRSLFRNPYLSMFMSSAVLEELAKLTFLVLGMTLVPKLKQNPVNWMVFGAAVGIGFGAVENVLYALKYGNSVLNYREVLSLTGHALDTGIGAYGLYSFQRKEINKLYLWVSIGMLSHGLFNLPSVLDAQTDIDPLAGIIIMLSVYLISIELFTMVLNNALNQSAHFRDNRAIPMKAVRQSLFALLVIMELMFLFAFMLEDSNNSMGVFLILSAPLIFFMQVLVMRLTSLVLVKGKSFPIHLAMPFALGMPDMEIPGLPRMRLRMRGLPYDESEFVRFMGGTMQLHPLARRASYFGDRAEVEMTQKVYAKSQILFYQVEFKSSDESIDDSRYYYLIPKFSGSNLVGKFRVAGLIYRNEPIDSSTEDIGTGSFCCWIKIPMETKRPWYKEFIRLLHARP